MKVYGSKSKKPYFCMIRNNPKVKKFKIKRLLRVRARRMNQLIIQESMKNL